MHGMFTATLPSQRLCGTKRRHWCCREIRVCQHPSGFVPRCLISTRETEQACLPGMLALNPPDRLVALRSKRPASLKHQSNRNGRGQLRPLWQGQYPSLQGPSRCKEVQDPVYSSCQPRCSIMQQYTCDRLPTPRGAQQLETRLIM